MNIRMRKNKFKINIKKDLDPKVLIDSAFLGQGMPMVKKEEILAKIGQFPHVGVVWFAEGALWVAEPEDFFNWPKDESWQRLDSAKLGGGFNGYCTGSVSMDVAADIGVGLVVTAGIGGVDRQGKACSDIPSLAAYPGLLVATAPKDILDLSATIDAWRALKVRLYGWQTDRADGFLFCKKPVILDRVFPDKKNENKGLLLCPIAHELRLQDLSILDDCCRIAEERPAGESPHPAVNAYLAKVTGGKASYIQLEALRHNIEIALQVAEDETYAGS